MSLDKLEYVYPDKIIHRGENYIQNVRSCIKIGSTLYAEVEGSDLYKTRIDLKTLEGSCSCPYGSNCKHAVAAFLVFDSGGSINADSFIESLQKMNKEELIKIIVDNLPNNPSIALKVVNIPSNEVEKFIDDFLDEFTYSKLLKAQNMLSNFSFNQLIRIIDYFEDEDNEDFIFEKIYEEYWVPDEGDVVYDFIDELKGKLVKKIKTCEHLEKALKYNIDHYIVWNAKDFLQYKSTLKNHFSKKAYLDFLLALDNPDLGEIKELLSKKDTSVLYTLPKSNLELAEKLASELDDNNLHFLVAIYEEDCSKMVKYFDQFKKLLKKDSRFLPLWEIVNILMDNQVEDQTMAQQLIKADKYRRFGQTQMSFLLKQIEDYEFIRKTVRFEMDLSYLVPFLERLLELDREKTAEIISNSKILQNRHWSEIAYVLCLMREMYGREYTSDFIQKNEDLFKTSSHLKSNLKNMGIYISYSHGKTLVDVLSWEGSEWKELI